MNFIELGPSAPNLPSMQDFLTGFDQERGGLLKRNDSSLTWYKQRFAMPESGIRRGPDGRKALRVVTPTSGRIEVGWLPEKTQETILLSTPNEGITQRITLNGLIDVSYIDQNGNETGGEGMYDRQDGGLLVRKSRGIFPASLRQEELDLLEKTFDALRASGPGTKTISGSDFLLSAIPQISQQYSPALSQRR